MAPPDKQGANTGLSPVQIVQRVVNETNPGWLEHQTRIGRFNRAYDVYRGNVRQNKFLKPWQSRLYVKYGMQVIDQAVVNMVQGTPRPICKPRRPNDVDAAKSMESALSYYADRDHLPEKEDIVAYQALVYGVSPGKTHWLYKERDQKTFTPAIDEESGALVWKPSTERIVECDRPSFTPWDAYDCWWDPYARDVDCSSYIVLRDWLTKDELNGKRYNQDTGVGTYRNLDLLFNTGQGEQPSPSAQNQLLGQSTNLYKGRFEIWEIWREDRLTVLGNRKILLYDGPKPYWMEGKPVTVSNTRAEPFRIEGISETELIDHLQQAIHTVSNLRMDNLKFTVMRGASYRESGITDPGLLVMRPAFLWPVTDHDDVQFHDPPPLPREAYQEEETLLGRLQYVTGITPYITGAQSQGADQNTATGVSLLQESASRLLTFKANRIRMLTWQRVFEQWGDLTKQFLTEEMDVRIEGPGNNVSWQKLGPQSVMGDFDIRILAGDESLSRQQERSEAVALLNALAPFAQAGLVSLEPLLEKVAVAYDFPAISSLFPQPGQNTASPFPQQQAATGPSPFTLGRGLATPPAQSILRGNAR